MFFSRDNLATHRIAEGSATRPGLAGVFVDPRRNRTVASDGKRLVEITGPKVDPKKYPAKGVVLANGDTDPFILPAETAQEILKVLPKGKDATDARQYAALVQNGKKLAIATVDGQKAHTFDVKPLGDPYPDFSQVFPDAKPLASLLVDPNLLRETLAVAGIGKSMTFHLFEKVAILESAAEDGSTSRAVIAPLKGKPAKYAAPKNGRKADEQIEAPEAEEPEETESEDEATASPSTQNSAATNATPARRGGTFRKRRFSDRRPPAPDAAPGAPTPEQRAFYTFLLHRHGEALTPEVLEDPIEGISDRISELKGSLPGFKGEATYAQWRKLYFLLLEKTTPEEACDILNGVTGIQETSPLIDEWLKKTPAAKAA